jgi:peptidoglycan L-alanyl-D-glutamate endopeptidase CwlK
MGDNIVKVTALHPKLADAVASILTEAKARGLNVGVFSGVRQPEEQQKLFDLGRTVVNPDGKSDTKPLGNIVTNGTPWSSWHNYGLAVDIVFKNEKGWTWEKTFPEWEELGKVGELFGVEWGGRWRFQDLPHFQKRGQIQGVGHAKEILFKDGLEKLWSMV